MYKMLLTLGIAAMLMGGGHIFAQHAEARLGPPIAMSLQSPLVSGETVKITYEIPYDGYIVFDLFSPDGQKIWTASAVKLKGTHVQVFKRTPLQANTQYSYEFWYKGKKYSGKFNNS